jgi:hypothetical protein
MPEATRMQLSNCERSEDPLRRFRDGWRLKARHAKDTWTPGTEPIETAMEGTFHDGIKFAAEFLEGEGQGNLAIKLRSSVERKA